MQSQTLAALLTSPAFDFFLLRLGEAPIGFCETLGSASDDTEIKDFGIVPAVYGRKFEPYLLDQAVRALWSRQPRRIWLRTDTTDHKAAISTYQRAGLHVFKHRWEDFAD